MMIFEPLLLEAQQRIAFWNVENYFDTYDDPRKEDEDFTPTGSNHWNKARYEKKRNDIAKTIAAMGVPDVVGMVEVENRRVLQDLCMGAPLRKMNYGIVHFESPDVRGIDCALIYRKKRVRLLSSRAFCVSDTTRGYRVRDILMAQLLMNAGDTLYCFVCHLPSRRGGEKSERRRYAMARSVVHLMDSVAKRHPGCNVLAMGDFNAYPEEVARFIKGKPIHSLMSPSAKTNGSYFYKGHWQLLDHMIAVTTAKTRAICANVFVSDFLIEKTGRRGNGKPYRTYLGDRYHGGISDHLPIYVDWRTGKTAD